MDRFLVWLDVIGGGSIQLGISGREFSIFDIGGLHRCVV